MQKMHTDLPQHMSLCVFEKEFKIDKLAIQEFWRNLNLRETFSKGQIFPYRVEFDSDSPTGKFLPGELNIHHGPFLSAHGFITDVTDSYRGLQYLYGSYVLSFRLVRPVKLEFFREEKAVRLRVTYYVTPYFHALWLKLNQIFWAGFARSIL